MSHTNKVRPVINNGQPKELLATNQQRRSFKAFLKKYFLEGQKLDDKLQQQIAENPQSWHQRYRKYIAFFIPFMFFQICWVSIGCKMELRFFSVIDFL